MVAKTYRRQDEDDCDILKDSERMRVPMYLMDGSMNHLDPLQRAVVRDRLRDARITVGARDSGLALHRPGYRVSDGVPRARSHYAAYDAEIATVYKNVGASEREFTGGGVSDVRGGRSGTEGSAGAVDNNPGDAIPVSDAREQAYLDYQYRIQRAWRDGR